MYLTIGARDMMGRDSINPMAVPLFVVIHVEWFVFLSDHEVPDGTVSRISPEGHTFP